MRSVLVLVVVLSLLLSLASAFTTVPQVHLSERRSSSAGADKKNADASSSGIVRLHAAQTQSSPTRRARPDSSAAVAEALRISRESGATSDDARIAWETVEEMDSSDPSPAMGERRDSNENDDADQKCMDYATQVRSLNQLLASTREKLAQIKTLATNLKQLDIDDPNLSKLPDTASGLKVALQEAKAATEVFGPDSAQSEQAWTEVDFCTDVMGGVECHVDSHYRYSAAALKAHHVYDAVVDAQFFQEAEQAVSMLQNLQRFVSIETKRLDQQYSAAGVTVKKNMGP